MLFGPRRRLRRRLTRVQRARRHAGLVAAVGVLAAQLAGGGAGAELAEPSVLATVQAVSAQLDTVAGVQGALDAVLAQAEAFGLRPEDAAVAVTDLQSGESWAVNGTTELSFMSSAKFPWVAFAVAAAGIPANVGDAADIFIESDNDAAGRVIERAGGIDSLADWYAVLGMTSTCTQVWGYTDLYAERECSAALGEYFNHSTAADMVTFLVALWQGTIPDLDAEERAAVLEWATWSADEWSYDGDGTLTGFLPPDVWPSVHHKVGWYWGDGFTDASDIGIVELPGGRSYAIAVAAHGGSSSADQAAWLSLASCEAYRAVSGDAAWDCGTQSRLVVAAAAPFLVVAWAARLAQRAALAATA